MSVGLRPIPRGRRDSVLQPPSGRARVQPAAHRGRASVLLLTCLSARREVATREGSLGGRQTRDRSAVRAVRGPAERRAGPREGPAPLAAGQVLAHEGRAGGTRGSC